eukprot:Tbor_TRINITY_DN4748_c0_g1::TRINITY_DN4748_c0_g1_i1::g.17082::m.17082/K09540/SEC63, DNAJC23; translocation protein SEC63
MSGENTQKPPESIGDDSSFNSFMFAIVSVAMICMYLPWIWGILSRLVSHFFGAQQRYYKEKNPLVELREAITFIPCVLFTIIKSPGMVSGGVEALIAQPRLAFSLYLPIFLKFIIRPKILVLWLWAVLFSAVLYATLTFDPHAILGVAATASSSEINKAYRKLSKQYHPDVNSTEAARVIYLNVKKAYRSLTKKDEFDQEYDNEEFRVGVALPTWMTSRENDTLVLFGMLGLILAVPIGLFFKFRDSGSKVPTLLEKIKNEKGHVSIFLHQLGIPKDPKYEEKKISRNETLTLLKSVGLAPEHATPMIVLKFPLFPEFVSRCINPEKYIASFKALGFDEDGITSLNTYVIDNADKIMEIYEKAVKESIGNSDPQTPVTLASPDKYKAIRYLLTIHVDSLNDHVKELQENMPGEVRSARKIAQIHRGMFDLLTLVFEREKPFIKHIQQLTNITRELDEAMEELIPDAEDVMRKYYRQYYEQQVGKKTFKMLEKKSRRANGE